MTTIRSVFDEDIINRDHKNTWRKAKQQVMSDGTLKSTFIAVCSKKTYSYESYGKGLRHVPSEGSPFEICSSCPAMEGVPREEEQSTCFAHEA